MSILDALRAGINTADKVTKPLQATITYEQAAFSTDGYSTASFPVAVELKAIVEWKKVQIRTAQGIITATRPVITIIDVAAVEAATGGVGISTNDWITLSDGTTGPIRNMDGAIQDPGTGQPVLNTFYLG